MEFNDRREQKPPLKGASWDQVVQRHPEMAEHDDAVHALAHGTTDDPQGEYSSRSAHDLNFESRNIPLRAVRNARTGDRYNDPRVLSAHNGYSAARGGMSRDAQDHKVPPILVVKRGSRYEVADGHHRAEAAKMSSWNTHINAVVARSSLPALKY